MNVGDNEGNTGFHFACFKGNLNVVQFLVQQGFDMNLSEKNGRTGFHAACGSKNSNLAQLIHQAIVDESSGFFDTGSKEVVQFLLEQGSDMNAVDNEGHTGFHIACFSGDLDLVQFFLQQGFDMNMSNIYGGTAFHGACLSGNLNIVQFLLQQGFDMNICNINGATGFHMACYRGNLNVVQFLLQQGFQDINKRFDSLSGLNMLINRPHDYPSQELFMPCILLLIEAGAELDENYVFEELISAIQNRIIEITFIKKTIFQKWTGRIAQAITDFTMEPFTNTSLQNLSQFLD